MSISQTDYQELGFTIGRGIIPQQKIDDLLDNFLSLVAEVSGKRFSSAHSAEVAKIFGRQPSDPVYCLPKDERAGLAG